MPEISDSQIASALSSVAPSIKKEDSSVSENVRVAKDVASDFSRPAESKEVKPSTKRKIPPASLQAMQKNQAKNRPVVGQFSEAVNSKLSSAVDNSPAIKVAMSKFKDLTPQQRAVNGTKLGTGIGLATNGPVGAVIGAAVGAMAGRGLGLAQSGEHELNTRRAKIVDVMANTGIMGINGEIKFKNDSVKIPLGQGQRLRNLSSLTGGAADRAPHEIDATNPLSRRATAVARPLAWALSGAMLNFKDPQNPKDVAAVDSATGMLVNILQEGAGDIGTVYERAAEIAQKTGFSEKQLRSFMDSIKIGIGEQEAGEIAQGLDILYGV